MRGIPIKYQSPADTDTKHFLMMLIINNHASLKIQIGDWKNMKILLKKDLDKAERNNDHKTLNAKVTELSAKVAKK